MNLPPALAAERFRAARVARLATVDATGRPHLVPVVFAVDGETVVLAIDHKPKARRDVRRLANIAANPAVSLLVDHYDDDWSALWWVRADGDATVVDDPAAMAGPIDLLVAKYPQYQRTRPAGPVILVRVHTWRGWAA
ncbi:MAG TPA: TIGR03668 family PPOX class F420-dependent oxidoreductase [Pseudonocardiaceae bacterium]|nr:TIGR03668 family PPOX class F420-dependent oxidoreductase [Pseudonocardiaceae bacterium]